MALILKVCLKKAFPRSGNNKRIKRILILIMVVLLPILVTLLFNRSENKEKEQTKMNKGKEIVLSVIASFPYAGGAVRQYDAIQLDKRFSALDSKMEDLYLKVEKSSGESRKRAIIDAIGQMKLLAGTGSIDVEGSLLEALNRITVNSQQGTIFIDGTRIAASQIRLSSENGGETTLTNTVSKSKGTKIDIGKGAQIKIKGNAKIDQN